MRDESGQFPGPIPKHPGYQPQAPDRLDLVNSNKVVEENILRFLDDLAATDDADKRWLAIARTHVEQGFMAINRAIMRPARLTDDELMAGERAATKAAKAATAVRA